MLWLSYLKPVKKVEAHWTSEYSVPGGLMIWVARLYRPAGQRTHKEGPSHRPVGVCFVVYMVFYTGMQTVTVF
jgi:hypothetical protein